MQLIEAPRLVDCIVAAIATSPLGEVGAVVVARDVERKYLMIVDALIGSFSDFDGFCETLYDRIDDLAGTIRSRASPVVFCEPDLFERCGRHSRLDLSAYGVSLGYKHPINATVDTRFFPPDAERDPARRAVMLAAGDDTVRLAATMARKILIHPFDQLASARYDPGASNVLADALGRAFDVTMISNAERNRARHRRGS
jgi:hypothetical protein